MYKKKSKAILSNSMMTVNSKVNPVIDYNKLEGGLKSTTPIKLLKKINPWPEIDSYLSNEDVNSRTTSSSWPEETTTKILNLWYNVERFIYREDDDDNENIITGDVLEECIQWRTQIPHFRIIGKQININDSEINLSNSNNKNKSDEYEINDILTGDNYQEKDVNKGKERIIDKLLEYIYSELDKKDEDDKINDDINQVLKIKPAPINRRKSANLYKSFQLTERINTAGSFKNLNEHVDNLSKGLEDENEDSDDDGEIPKLSRNKLGTVFNKKVVVSPVPFAVSTRESFCTLKTTPIRYAGHLLELSTPQESGKTKNCRSKGNSAQRKSSDKLTQTSGFWQTSVYPTVWPKNVKLAPIDPTRLPSSKRRSAVISTSLPQRNRNSLSPILRPASHRFNSEDFLEIEGKNFVTRSSLKTGRDLNSNKYKRNQK